ncbi:MAG: purine/pyrimidine permease [Deltaproteobacteria bacterium]|nr:purine/pyrimidine permease [Deltaproteobacteria bacterium]
MEFKYGVDDWPPPGETLLFAAQWLALSVPTIVIIGKVLAVLHFTEPADQVVYLQKLFFVAAVALLVQVLWGHRLPLLLGPATVLLIGVTASQGFALDTVYASVFWGGAVLTLLSLTGLFGHVQRLFTPRIVAVVLLLIAFTLAPTIVRLVAAGPAPSPVSRLYFTLGLVAATFTAHRVLAGVWRSTLIVWSTAVGSVAYALLFPGLEAGGASTREPLVAGFLHHLTGTLEPHPAVLFSFLVCFLALAVNDFGSIQSVTALLRLPDPARRISRGIAVTGLANALSGLLGVVGPVDYSLSPGVLASTRCASRFTLLPTALALFVLSVSPAAIGWVGAVPPVVVGGVLLYILGAQIATGLLVAFATEAPFSFDGGLVIGFSVLLGSVFSLLPPATLDAMPVLLRPLLGNGFVVGVLAALALEHGIFRR